MIKSPEGQTSVGQAAKISKVPSLGKFIPAKLAAFAAMAALATACQDDGVCYNGRCADGTASVAADSGAADAGSSVDAGMAVDVSAAVDTGAADAGTTDTGTTDTGAEDATGTADLGTVDAGAVDCVTADLGAADVGVPPVDAGAADIGPVDTGAVDVGPKDVGATDTGSADVGPADTGVKVDTNTGNTATPGDQILFPGCATEIPRAQQFKSTDEYQAFVAYSQDPAGTVEDLGANGDLLASDNVNGQKFNVPFSKYAKVGQEGHAVRVMAAAMPANAQVKTSIVTEDISTTPNVGPLVPIKMTGKVDPQSVCEAVRAVVMSGSKCPDLQCVADKLNANFAAALTNELGYSPAIDIQPITPGDIGTADGQVFGPKGGVYAVVSGMPRDNCTEAIQSGKVKTGN